MGFGFTALFLLLLITAGWWLYSRWSALREARDARREAELMVVFEARSKMSATPVRTTPTASDFYPTLPEEQTPQPTTAKPVRSANDQRFGPRS